jgi:flavin-dependent dehydrogenase
LDAVLANAARSAGVTVWTRTSLTSLTYDRHGRVDGVVVTDRRGGLRRIAARHVVGADGLRSTTARLIGAPVVRRFVADTTLFYAYVEGLDDRGIEFAVAAQGFAGVFPTHDGMSCVWLTRPTRLMDRLRAAGRERASAFAHELGSVDAELGDRVRRSPQISLVRGFVAAPNIIRQAVGPGWSLVGDAASFRDPITGHGITDAFRDAELLARAIDAALADPASEPDALASYAESQDAALEPIFRLTELLARFPEPAAFVDLQIRLSDALDEEARMLAGLPDQPGSRQPAAA